jgi:hypothetical protein
MRCGRSERKARAATHGRSSGVHNTRVAASARSSASARPVEVVVVRTTGPDQAPLARKPAMNFNATSISPTLTACTHHGPAPAAAAGGAGS